MAGLDQLVAKAIVDGVFPGAAWAYGTRDWVEFGCAGSVSTVPDSAPVSLETVWDLASVSKVVGTTTAAMMLYESGAIGLDEKVADALPEFGARGKGHLTFRDLLEHKSGLAAFRPYHRRYRRAASVWSAICAEDLVYETGSKMVYSDLGMVALAKAIEARSGEDLARFLEGRVWNRLGMSTTMYVPDPEVALRAAPVEPVEPWREALWLSEGRSERWCELSDGVRYVQGEVHDPTATVLGGVAGHAGLFSTVSDVAAFARAWLAGGAGIVRPETLAVWTRRQSELSTRALGWDTKSEEGSSAGSRFGPRSYGHTGFTGTSLWIDPEAGRFAALLSNRVHPSAANTKIVGFRPVFHDAVWENMDQRS